MDVVEITDPGDPRVGDYVRLTDRELRSAVEGREGRFIVEGALAIRRLLESDYEPRSVLVTQKRLDELADAIGDLDVPVYVAPQSVLNEVAGFNLHRGAVASAHRPPPRDPVEVLSETSCVAVVEGLSDHENLGVIFRTAAAFGVGAVLLSPSCCDPLYRRTVRVSMGHVLAVPFARLTPWPDALDAVRRHDFRLIALTPSADADRITDVEVQGRTAIMVGAEGPGLSSAALEAADARVRIPMAAGVDSLNVATAAAIAFHRLCPMP